MLYLMYLMYQCIQYIILQYIYSEEKKFRWLDFEHFSRRKYYKLLQNKELDIWNFQLFCFLIFKNVLKIVQKLYQFDYQI